MAAGRLAWRVALLGALTLGLGASARAAVSATDDTGRLVRLLRPAQRVISLAPHATELLYGVDAGDQLVGAIEFSDYPAAAKRLPRVGGARGLDLERIASLKPDLVVAWQSGNGAAQVERIEGLGIPVFRSEPRELDDIATSLLRLGVLTGHTRAALGAAQEFRARIAHLRVKYMNRAPVRAFYQVWNQPLMTVGGNHLITDLLRMCGAVNVFASLATPAPTVSVEAEVAAAPEIIIAAASQTASADLAIWKKWTRLPAVRNRQLVTVDPDLVTRHTERVAQGAAQLCDLIEAARSGR